MEEAPKEIVWMGSTKNDLADAPASVKRTMGGALRTAQQVGKSDDADPMKGDLRDVMEVRTTMKPGFIGSCTLQKSANTSSFSIISRRRALPVAPRGKEDLDRIRQRLRKAREQYATTKQ